MNVPAYRFICDVHLGRLAHYRRMLGFDSVYRNDYTLNEQVAQARVEHRILLSRNPPLYKRSEGSLFVRLASEDPEEQLKLLIGHLHLAGSMQPFSRCMACNEVLLSANKETLVEELPPNTRKSYEEFWRCVGCGRIYWRGPHYARMQSLIQRTVPTT